MSTYSYEFCIVLSNISIFPRAKFNIIEYCGVEFHAEAHPPKREILYEFLPCHGVGLLNY